MERGAPHVAGGGEGTASLADRWAVTVISYSHHNKLPQTW